MIETVYIELPFEKITYLDRPEFHKEEKEFKEALTSSITTYGMKDPVYCWFSSFNHTSAPVSSDIMTDLSNGVLRTCSLILFAAALTL